MSLLSSTRSSLFVPPFLPLSLHLSVRLSQFFLLIKPYLTLRSSKGGEEENLKTTNYSLNHSFQSTFPARIFPQFRTESMLVCVYYIYVIYIYTHTCTYIAQSTHAKSTYKYKCEPIYLMGKMSLTLKELSKHDPSMSA